MRLAILAWAAVATGCSFLPDHRFDGHDLTADAGADAQSGPERVQIAGGIAIEGDRTGTDLANVGDKLSVDGLPVHRVYVSGYEITSRCISNSVGAGGGVPGYGDCVVAGQCSPLPDTHADYIISTKAQAAAYCAFIHMRLPTEAELERAWRGDDGTVLSVAIGTSPHGLFLCSEAAEWVSDGYRCDAYVNRAWADPMEASGPELFRAFAPTSPPSPIGPRLVNPVDSPAIPGNTRGFHCARTVDTTPPPAPPVQPTCTSGAMCGVSAIGLGLRFGCALRDDASVWCWGSNADGALATGELFDAIPASTAHRALLPAAAAIAVGRRSACALATNGDVSCWGLDRNGQLGDGALASRATPFRIFAGAAALSGAGDHACAITSVGGQVVCWGKELIINGSTTPVGLPITGALAIASSAAEDCVMRASDVLCWGTGFGGTPAAPLTFAIAASQIAVGLHHACAVVGTAVQCVGDRRAWGGTGTAVTMELVMSGLTAPRVVAAPGRVDAVSAANATIIFSAGVPVLNVGTDLPSTIDGRVIALDANAPAGGCASKAGGSIVCVGHELGQLGASNACGAAAVTTTMLALP